MHRRLLRCCCLCCCCCLVLLLLISVGAATKNEKCGDTIKIKEPSYLISPGYPVNYYPSQRCEWIIQAPEKYQRIVINFNPHFDLEDRECKYDFVELYDGDNASGRFLGKFCGKIAPPPLVSPGPTLFIRFVSDYETHGAGFSIRYELFKTGPECSRNFTDPTGVIKSPGYPEKYPNALECTYTIFAQKMSEIIVEFEGFELELDSNSPASLTCRYDYLEIWDGFPGVGPHIGRYCGQNTPGRIRSSTGILTMIFHTDNAIAKEGFSANYTVLQSNAEEDIQNETRAPSAAGPSAASSTQSSRAFYTQEDAMVVEEVESVYRPMLIVEVDHFEPQEATTFAQETRPDRVKIAKVVADLQQCNREIERTQERLREMQQTIKNAMDVLERL